MRKFALLFCCTVIMAACDKHDPILPGIRTEIFDTGKNQNILNIPVPDLPESVPTQDVTDCPYTIDKTNTIYDGDRKIFVGFPAPNSMDVETKPVCGGGYVYAGLNTGSVVKVAPATRRVIWMADVYSESNMMGGAATVDIVAPLVLDGSYVYVGGMGDSFCKINVSNGAKKWCVSVGTRHQFIVLNNVAYVVGLDSALYAIRLTDGSIYWRTDLSHMDTPKYQDKIITVHRKKYDASTGAEI